MAAKTNPVKPIESVEEFDTWLEKSQDILLVIDVHQGWSGQTETLIPTFNRVMLDTEQADKRVAILSASIPTFASKVQELGSDDAKLGDVGEKGCSPLFLAVRFGKAVGMVEGANSPALVELITEQIPDLKEEQD